MSARRAILGGALALVGLPGLSACQQQTSAETVPLTFKAVDGIGYLVFNAPILSRTRDFVVADMRV